MQLVFSPETEASMNAEQKEEQARGRDKLRQHFLNQDVSVHTKRWDDLWKDGSCLPWDRGEPSPALEDALVDRKDLLGNAFADGGGPSGAASRRKRALVPGCGSGYDVLLLASFGYDIIGLDASETVIEKDEQFAEGSGNKKEYAARNKDIGKGSVKFILGDFFSNDWFDGVGFDLIFDYTVRLTTLTSTLKLELADLRDQFLCALPLSLRPKWAHRMAELLSPRGGHLICLEFPTTKPPSSGGPPWAVPPLVYEELLARPGEDISYDKEDKVVQSSSLKPNSDRLVRVAHWKPKRTHAAGVGSEWVSIWRHQ